MTTSDPTRSPAGTESAWAYTHVPHGIDWTRAAARRARASGWRTPSSGVAPGFRDSAGRPARAVARATCEAAERQPGRRGDQRAARRGCTSSWCSGPLPAWAGPRRRCPASTSPAPRPTPAAGCTGPAGGTPPARPRGDGATGGADGTHRTAGPGSSGLGGDPGPDRWWDRLASGRDALAVPALGQVGQAPQGLDVARADRQLPQRLRDQRARPRDRVLRDGDRARLAAAGRDGDDDLGLAGRPAARGSGSARLGGGGHVGGVADDQPATARTSGGCARPARATVGRRRARGTRRRPTSRSPSRRRARPRRPGRGRRRRG